MKKIKYRNNNNYNNQVYSINYKFDSISPAGKCCGTALDLIKRYNELAKEAHGNGNYVEAEVFRQYAEHYRKIITEINERKNARFGNKDNDSAGQAEAKEISAEENTAAAVESGNKTETTITPEKETTLVETKPKTRTVKKAFKVIEISDKSAITDKVAKEAVPE